MDVCPRFLRDLCVSAANFLPERVIFLVDGARRVGYNNGRSTAHVAAAL